MFSDLSISHAPETSRAQALRQVLIVGIVSCVPLLVGFTVRLNSSTILSLEVAWDALRHTFLTGQVYFYAVSICASITWLLASDSNRTNQYAKVWLTLFIILCFSFASAFIGLTQASEAGPKLLDGILSIAFLLASLFMFYRMLILSYSPPPTIEETNRAAAEKLIDQVTGDYD